MYRFNRISVFIFLLILASCVASKTNNSKTTLSKSIASVVLNWDNILSDTDLSEENINSWLPNRGIRGRYELAKKYLSVRFMEEIIGEKVFLKGPHAEEIDFKSEEFGYYNPKFLKKLYDNLKSLYSNKEFIESTQALYDSRLKQYLRTFYLSYEIAVNNEEIISGYKKAIIDPSQGSYMNWISGPSYYLQESFAGFAQSIEGKGYDIYEGFTCPGFWIRRSIDGTEKQFYELLVLTISYYDQEFLNEHKNLKNN